jgi:hypothetical protein
VTTRLPARACALLCLLLSAGVLPAQQPGKTAAAYRADIKALEAGSSPDWAAVCSLWADLGALLYAQRQLDESLTAFGEGVTRYDSAGLDAPALLFRLKAGSGIARAARSEDDYPRAFAELTDALGIARYTGKVPMSELLGFTFISLGFLQQTYRSDAEAAEACYRSSVKVYRAAGSSPNLVARSQWYLAAVLAGSGRLGESVDALREAAAAVEARPAAEQERALLANIYKDLAQFTLARAYREERDGKPTDLAPVYRDVAETYRRLFALEKAGVPAFANAEERSYHQEEYDKALRGSKP